MDFEIKHLFLLLILGICSGQQIPNNILSFSSVTAGVWASSTEYDSNDKKVSYKKSVLPNQLARTKS
ncbi:hypothetical protein [Thiomicrorhabdus sediminis]|uniref:Uncharacterized protein n=1 Tax=Thiomicrorhabdus sediminis TaxID=2580412 RepID=A0A4P9K4C9_9GAMM|nr:hypothetical protein [Thiomicrorhabdus sediminis]QCU89782.1 hypothetical protein FE785_03580 [Thiomicrorhabdus sediminis]